MRSLIRSVFPFLFALALPQPASGKPMMPPTDEEATAFGQILSAEYVERDTSQTPTYFEGAIARYRVQAVHKGAPLSGVIRVRYAFHDLSACIEGTGWKFAETMMPKKGSRWILFVRNEPDTSTYYAYRGAVGRWPLSDENLAKVKQLLEAEQARPKK